MTVNSDCSVYCVPAPGEPAIPLLAPAEIKQRKTSRRAYEAKQKRKQTARQRWELLNAFTDSGMAELKPADVAVWVAFFRHASSNGVVRLSRDRLINTTRLSPRTIKTAIARLILSGWLERIHSGGPVAGIAEYRVKLGCKFCTLPG